MSKDTTYELPATVVGGDPSSGGNVEAQLGYRGLREDQLQQIIEGNGVAELLLDRDQVILNQDLLDEGKMLHAAERGGEVHVLVSVSRQ